MNNITRYFERHVQAGLSSLGQFTRTPFASFMMCLVIGITLALPTALYLAIKNIDHAGIHFQQTTQLTLFLKKNISEAQADNLLQRLEKQADISRAYTISPEEGLADLQKQAGFQGAVGDLQENPLPWAIVVIPTITEDNTVALDKFTQTLRQLPEVDSTQLDMLWVKRLSTMLALAKRIALALALLLGTAVLLIINNSIRSATQLHHREIEVIKLIGGTNSFIRRPFLYAGMLYGLLGGIIAWQLVDILLVTVRAPIHHLARLYNNVYDLTGMGLSETFALLGISIALGLIGSWLAVMRHLRS